MPSRTELKLSDSVVCASKTRETRFLGPARDGNRDVGSEGAVGELSVEVSPIRVASKNSMFCLTPFSVMVKSSAFKSLTTLPFLSLTVTSTFTRFELTLTMSSSSLFFVEGFSCD